MTYKISAPDILALLNDLGYTNITAQQLKTFIHDLKVVMKHDSKQKQERETKILRRHHTSPVEYYSTITKSVSDAKSSRQNIISVEMKNTNVELSSSDCCKFREEPLSNAQTTAVEERLCSCSTLKSTKVTNKVENKDNNANVDGKSESKKCLSQKVPLKPAKMKSFIRPKVDRTTCKINKSDPVALYHHYQSEWKKMKFPGEDNRPGLRWAIREKMLGDNRTKQTPSAAPSIERIKRPCQCRA